MVCRLVLIYFDRSQLDIQSKKTVWNFRLMIQRYGQFWFFRKRLGNSFSTTLCVWFFKKMFLMWYYINWPNFIVWLPLRREILGNVCIAIVCLPGYDVINFENNLIFYLSHFSTWPKKATHTFKYLENEESF